MAKMTMEAWQSARLAHYRAITPHPGTTCRHHGGLVEWREINESGRPTPGTEWAYCPTGHRMRGEVSPWADKAHADWRNTGYMKRQTAKWNNARTANRIKFSCDLGRRVTLIDTTN